MVSVKIKIACCILFALSLSVMSCHKKDDHGMGAILCYTPGLALKDSNDYFAFGRMNSNSLVDYGKFYQIRNGHLFSANMVTYNGQLISNNYALPAAKYQLALPLIGTFPDAARCAQDSVLGMPDSHDQGTLLVEYKAGNILRRWTIDPDTSSLSVSLKPYSLAIGNVLSQL